MPELTEPLSERELDVLQCMANGASNREIAQTLSISPNTVKVHLRNIYAKLGVSSRTEATTVAIQQRVIEISGMGVELTTPAQVNDGGEDDGEGKDEAAGSPVAETAAQPPALAPVTSSSAVTNRAATAAGTSDAAARLPWRRLAVGTLVLLVLGLAVTLVWQILAANSIGETSVESEPFVEQPIDGSHWRSSRAMPQPRSHMALVAVGLNIYQIGGEDENGVVNDVMVYDTDRLIWHTAAPKLTAVADATADVLAGEIYVPGGRQANGQPTTSVEVYSPANNAWRTVSDLPRPISGGLALSDGSYLYLFGGWDGQNYLADNYFYDPASGQWHPLPPMSQGRAFTVGGLAAGQIYVVGGSDGSTDLALCERFDLLDNTWAECPPLNRPRAAAGAVVLLNQLYVFGGDASFGEKYSPQGEAWESIDMPMLDDGGNWRYLGVTHVETNIYTMGGRRGSTMVADNYVYRPLVYQFFIPAASSGSD